jgi:hypothetical protein
MAADPDVASADPVPIAAEPYETGLRGDSIHFDLRCGRSDCDYRAAAVVSRRGRDYAAAEKRTG